MATSNSGPNNDVPPDGDDVLLDAADAAEEIPEDPDHPMDSDAEDDGLDTAGQEEIQLQNDSIAHFDRHTDSIFCIAQHPRDLSVIATGGGDDTTYVFAAALPSRVLPASYESDPNPSRPSIEPIAKLTGHTDSINALAFTLPSGDYLLSGGLDGGLRAHTTSSRTYSLLAETQEVPEINFIACCPHPAYPNTLALGASDGSVWVYTVDAADTSTGPLRVIQAYYLHTESCTAGAWTPDGKLLATVSEDSSLYVWDPFGEAAAVGIGGAQGSQAVVGLTASDQRFCVEGGLFSVAVAPSGAFLAVGGAGGMIRVVGLPRLSSTATSATAGQKGAGSKSKSGGGKKAGAVNSSNASAGQSGTILASLQAQSDGVETLAFASAPLSLLAAGSVDGTIALFDTAHSFALRRHIKEAHEEYAVVQVGFSHQKGHEHLLTSCGMDGVLRQWDTRGGTAATGQGSVREWRGHRGEGEGGGILGFVQGEMDGTLVTAGDDGVALVFEAGKIAV